MLALVPVKQGGECVLQTLTHTDSVVTVGENTGCIQAGTERDLDKYLREQKSKKEDDSNGSFR